MILKPRFIKNVFLNNLFPSLCLSCHEKIDSNFFCQNCSALFEVESSYERRNAYVFDHSGPLESLIKELKRFQLPNLFLGAASFLVVRFYYLDWPLPDVVTFVTPFDKRLALAFSKFFQLPVKELLVAKRRDFFEYELEVGENLGFKTVLLISLENCEKLDEARRVLYQQFKLFTLTLRDGF